MKKRTLLISLSLALTLALTLTLALGYAAAAGGDAADPLISLEYLRGVFAPAAEKAAQEKIDASGDSVYDAAEAEWRAALAAADASAGSEHASAWTDARLKQNDILSGLTGTQVMLLAGDASVRFSSGAVVDATDGVPLASGAALKARHRYLVAEDTTALFTVTSRTAVLDYCGDYHVTASAATDYNSMAYALRTLSLFKGSDTGYGEGFDLEKTPTRIQALIMLIRLLGEEDAALASTARHPFTDVPEWAERYVAYAYERGYTNGVAPTRFGTQTAASVDMYTEFLLRALSYSSTAQRDISDALDRAFNAGVVTSGERAFLRSNAFLRADVAYLSWYALDVTLPGGTLTLHEKLERLGVFSPADYRAAAALVTSERL